MRSPRFPVAQQSLDPNHPETVAGHAHLIGACGSGMKAVAEYLGARGWSMSGSDSSASPAALERFRERGLRLHAGHDRQHVPDESQLVVYSPAVDESNPELRRARSLGVPCRSYAEFLGDAMRTHTGVSIAGTHGKSTTTAMVVHVLRTAGLDPSAILGAELHPNARSGFAGSGDLFVAESCEFRRHFLHQQPQYAAILAVEWDHVDCFPRSSDLEQAFLDFAARMPRDGCLILNDDCPATPALKNVAPGRCLTFGTDARSDWWAEQPQSNLRGLQFQVRHSDRVHLNAARPNAGTANAGTVNGAPLNVELPMPGLHNLQNALAAIALCVELGVAPGRVCEALGTFPGIRRRFEVLGDWGGVTVIDDFAHHPTAVRATLRTVRDVYPGRRVWCLFQPHQVSRTHVFLDEFAGALALADRVLVTPAFAAREVASARAMTVSQELVARVNRCRGEGRFTESLDRLLTTVEDEARPDDVVVTMGAGDIFQVHDELNRRLQRNHSA